MTEPEITICCLKKGDRYRPYYVNILEAMARRNVHKTPYDFVCFTDDPEGIDSGIRTEPLPYDAPGWWGKMGLYMKKISGIHTKRLLFLDLDTVIAGPLDDLLNYPGEYVLAKDWPTGAWPTGSKKDRQGQTSAILIEVGSRTYIWDQYWRAGHPTDAQFGDQEWITKEFPSSMTLLPESLVQSYKLHRLAGQVPPACSVIMFHGTPKPPDCGGWVKDYWLMDEDGKAEKTRYDYLLNLVKEKGYKKGCEVGLWYGRTFLHLLSRVPDLILFGVDNWSPCDADHDRDQTANRKTVYNRAAGHPGARIIEASSLDAARVFTRESLDFVFLDADHSESAVRADIEAWKNKIRPGGILCGDDYDMAPVKAAVDSLLPGANILGGFFWWVEVGKEAIREGDAAINILGIIDLTPPQPPPEQELFNDVWKNGRYRLGSTALRLLPFLREHIPAGSVVNDYGSGTGRAEKGLLEFCSKVNMVDFADAALEGEARSLIGKRLTYTIAPLESLPVDFPVADRGICINVLMTVDPGKLDRIMAEMRRTCRNLIIEVYDWPDIRLGRDLTAIKGDGQWWAAKMKEYWPFVESHKSPENARRYITIGKTT
ncbi:MAG: class I SAM-dependent methyltransferase [Candidatus Omnitrophota bacterium]|nr:class I SAM-dependent methyltransferase [Candidatus Omnitrophota bacterium]